MITDYAQCQAAAKTAGKDYKGTESDQTFPRGCFFRTSVGVFFNDFSPGGANQKAQLLCAVTAGLRARMCVCVRGR